MLVLAISRASRYSPGRHADNDRLILEHTARELSTRGAEIAWLSEDRLEESIPQADLILSMCQGPKGTAILADHEARGARIVNSPRAVAACYRANLFRLLGRDQREFPETVVVGSGSSADDIGLDGPVWLKRGDVQSIEPRDVIRADDRRALAEILASFRLRGIEEVIVQRHAPGVVVKFYGVRKTSFFQYYAEHDISIHPVEVERARSRIEALVDRVGLEVYGGDCVVGPDGSVLLIDLNDWPSYAYFRAQAAAAIADYVARPDPLPGPAPKSAAIAQVCE